MTPPDDVSTRLDEIRERVETATERTEWQVGVSYDEGWPVYRIIAMDPPVKENAQVVRRFIQESAADVPYLLSLVERQREQIDQLGRRLKDAREAVERMPQDALGRDPNDGYYYRDELLHRIDTALRDAAQEEAE